MGGNSIALKKGPKNGPEKGPESYSVKETVNSERGLGLYCFGQGILVLGPFLLRRFQS